MGMTIDDFETKALQVLLSQRFIDLPLFEEEELSNYEITDIQGSMPFDDFIRQYAEIIMEQVKATYETRLKADMVAMLEDLNSQIEKIFYRQRPFTWDDTGEKGMMDIRPSYDDICSLIQQKINTLKEQNND